MAFSGPSHRIVTSHALTVPHVDQALGDGRVLLEVLGDAVELLRNPIQIGVSAVGAQHRVDNATRCCRGPVDRASCGGDVKTVPPGCVAAVGWVPRSIS